MMINNKTTVLHERDKEPFFNVRCPKCKRDNKMELWAPRKRMIQCYYPECEEYFFVLNEKPTLEYRVLKVQIIDDVE